MDSEITTTMGEVEDVMWQRDLHERKTVVMIRRILRRVVRVWVAVDGEGEEVDELGLASAEGMASMRRQIRYPAI